MKETIEYYKGTRRNNELREGFPGEVIFKLKREGRV